MELSPIILIYSSINQQKKAEFTRDSLHLNTVGHKND